MSWHMNDFAPDNLLFSFVKEIPTPGTKAGKVWRVHINNGSLNVNDRIIITSVMVGGYMYSGLRNIEVTIKSIHEEFDIAEGVLEANTAYMGSIVSINLKNCYADGKRINKRDIKVTKQSIGLSIYDTFNQHHSFYVRFANAEKAFDVIREGQEVLLLWFGKRIAANIVKISDSLEGMYIKLVGNKTLAIPENRAFRNLDAIRNIKIHLQYGGKIRYISGVFDFDHSA
jgi:hypothetical protein